MSFSGGFEILAAGKDTEGWMEIVSPRLSSTIHVRLIFTSYFFIGTPFVAGIAFHDSTLIITFSCTAPPLMFLPRCCHLISSPLKTDIDVQLHASQRQPLLVFWLLHLHSHPFPYSSLLGFSLCFSLGSFHLLAPVMSCSASRFNLQFTSIFGGVQYGTSIGVLLLLVLPPASSALICPPKWRRTVPSHLFH